MVNKIEKSRQSETLDMTLVMLSVFSGLLSRGLKSNDVHDKVAADAAKGAIFMMLIPKLFYHFGTHSTNKKVASVSSIDQSQALVVYRGLPTLALSTTLPSLLPRAKHQKNEIKVDDGYGPLAMVVYKAKP